MTPNELNLYSKAKTENIKSDWDTRIAIAYYNAYFQRVERMPKLEDFLYNKPVKKKQNPEEIMNEILKLNAKMGGVVI